MELPAAALHPTLKVAAPTGEGRSANTLIVNRSKTGAAALVKRNMEPTPAQAALRDFSSLHPPEVQTWNKGYLNELAYAASR